jgi:tetratricopeptide (TPR) repeat protein
VACCCFIPTVRADEDHHHPIPEKLGTVDFPAACSTDVSRDFQRSVALLHSFAYGESEKSFAAVAAKDPQCAMAYWGVAMSLFHPIWAAGNPAAAPSPAELTRGSEAIQKAKAIGGKTQRERDYIAAVEAFYTDAGGYPERALAFERGMEAVHRNHPKDKEATIFYSLALLGTAPLTDKTYAKQKKAAELLNAVLPETPDHPGVAHYLIHSFDYPELATLALPAARAYAKIAPSAPHALHMPSHIFIRLGLWDDSIESNLASAETARAHVAKTGPAGPGAGSFDELHALDYLAYAYLQKGQDEKANGVLDRMKAVQTLDVPNFAAAYAMAAVPARYALERRRWSEAAALTVPPAPFPWSRFSYAEALVHFAKAVGSARAKDVASARSGLERLDAIHAGLVQAKDAYWADQVEIQRRASRAWLARAEGKDDEALTLMRSAADLEDATEKHPVTPGQIVPARELLGDLLAELERPAEALKAYEAALATTPGRFASLHGAAKAAEQTGDKAKAKALYARLVAQCPDDSSRRELTEARAFVAKVAAR